MSSDTKVKFLIPKWLDNEFLEGILKNYYKNNEIEVTSFEAKSALANGEGYMSTMYRVRVDFSASMETENQVIIFQ